MSKREKLVARFRQGVRTPSPALAARLKAAGFKFPRRARKSKEVQQ